MAVAAPYVPGQRHSFMVSNERFEIDARYTPISPLGSGAFGVVCACHDSVTGAKVAVKKVKNAFSDARDAKMLLREIKLLRHLQHENIIPLIDIQPPASPEQFNDVYHVTEMMDCDLHRINYSQKLTDDHVQCFIYQIFKALKYIHSAGVIHRDLKPANLLVNKNCDLKVCDFGLARSEVEGEMTVRAGGFGGPGSSRCSSGSVPAVVACLALGLVGAGAEAAFAARACTYSRTHALTQEYVVTRWYRAPELILTREYDNSIDIWSAGCIIAELLTQKPIFKGNNFVDQLEKICALIGPEAACGEKRRGFQRSTGGGLPRVVRGWVFMQQLTNAMSVVAGAHRHADGGGYGPHHLREGCASASSVVQIARNRVDRARERSARECVSLLRWW
jgi:mitogen-activated protein kinase 6